MQAMTTCLRRLGGGATVGISIESGRLMVEPKPRPRYTLAELLAASDFAVSPTAFNQASWFFSSAVRYKNNRYCAVRPTPGA